MHGTLKAFLERPEDDYQWQCLESTQSDGKPVVHISHIELTSQYWIESLAAGVDHPVWRHRLSLYLPADADNNKPCLLMINGGARHEPAMEAAPSSQVDAEALCRLTGAPVACLRDVPNQPLIFADGKPRCEDDLVAWSWKKYLQNPIANRFVPLQWPMVKSVVKAMDAIVEYSASSHHPVQEFILSGASKRGWVSWLSAASDQRVSAVIPLVIDVLNVQTCIRHHLIVYQGWAAAISDYASADHDILAEMDSEAMQQLLSEVDPVAYKNQLHLPKLIINAASDEFFPPDSARFYYHQLPGPSWLRYLPNASHYLGRDPAVDNNQIMASAFGALTSDRTMPDMAWQNVGDDGLELRVNSNPLKARAWICHNPESRDFRKDTLASAGLTYTATSIKPVSTHPWVYAIKVAAPESGWKAFFIELTFNNSPCPDLILTSGVRVTPDQYE